MIKCTSKAETVLKLACMALHWGADIRSLEAKIEDEIVEFNSPKQEDAINDDTLDEVDGLISKIEVPVEFTTQFVHLFFLARKI